MELEKIFKEANKMRAKYGWGERRKQMEEIDANQVKAVKYLIKAAPAGEI